MHNKIAWPNVQFGEPQRMQEHFFSLPLYIFGSRTMLSLPLTSVLFCFLPILLSEKLQDMTMFQMSSGLLRLTAWQMRWTNSVPIFHEDVTYILRDEILDWAIPYIDDVPVKQPVSHYKTGNDYKQIPENPGIRQFVKKHFEVLHRICQCMKYAEGIYSGKKSILIVSEYIVLEYRCT